MNFLEDPLQPVSWTRIEELSKKLVSDAPYSLSVYGALQMALRWKDIDASPQIVVYITNRDCFEDGGIVGVFKESDSSDPFYRVFLYSFSEDTTTLQNALVTTKRLNWNSSKTRILFAAVPEKLMPLVESFVSHRNSKIQDKNNVIYKWRTADQLDMCKIECPPEVRLAPLGLESVDLITSQWFDEEGTADYITTLIKHGSTMGVYLRSTGELCAWVLFSEFCTLTALHTMEKHRRKGYAQLLCNAMCEQLLSERLIVGATVFHQNTNSLRLFDSLSFKSSSDFFVYAIVIPSTNEPHMCKK